MPPTAVHHAAILAGGTSSRMGREKALVEWRGQPLIAHVAAILRPIFPHICVVTSKTEVARSAGFPSISDRFPARGPLGGIDAAVSHWRAPTFVVACDMPFLNTDFIRYLSLHFEKNALVPSSDDGIEPLHAVYDPTCLPIFEKFLRGEAKMPSLRRVISELDAQILPLETARGFDATMRCFSNWNTPEDLKTGPATRAT